MALTICRQFFDYLNDSQIRYCHWKSNLRLAKALEGKTDLDLLVDRDSQRRFEEALGKFPFKKMLSPPSKRYPGVEDYLGFDVETGRFIHLHVHYDLVLGQKFIKNHTLPISSVVFNHLVLKEELFIPCPEMELIILIIRAHLKSDLIALAKQAVKNLMGQAYSPFPAQIDEELDDLIKRCRKEKMGQLLQECQLAIPERLFFDFVAHFPLRQLSCLKVAGNNRQIQRALNQFQRQDSLLLQMKYALRLLTDSPLFQWLVWEKKKTLPGAGRIVALVGADGSGKSTLIKEIETWLSWKLAVDTCYFGIPKSTWIRVFTQGTWGLEKLGLSQLARQFEKVLWVLVAWSRLKSYRKTLRNRELGRVIIADRYPLSEFHKMEVPMDGPRLIRRDGYFSRLEQSLYAKIGTPDKILVLNAELSVLRTRKMDLDLKTHQAKVDAINALQPNQVQAIIDASQPFSAVQLEAKRIIWDVL
jgi:thymidylate kinase